MKIEIQLSNKGRAVLENDPDNMVFLDEILHFLLTALHAQGFSYVHNLIAVKDGGTSTSATKEYYNIKQVWTQKELTKTVLISVETLTNLQNDVSYYQEQYEQYRAIRNRMAEEINELRATLDMPKKYDIVAE